MPGHQGPDKFIVGFTSDNNAPHMFGNGIKQEFTHDSQDVNVKQLLDLIDIGDYFLVKQSVGGGGGGGHRLTIKNFRITVVMFRLDVRGLPYS